MLQRHYIKLIRFLVIYKLEGKINYISKNNITLHENKLHKTVWSKNFITRKHVLSKENMPSLFMSALYEIFVFWLNFANFVPFSEIFRHTNSCKFLWGKNSRIKTQISKWVNLQNHANRHEISKMNQKVSRNSLQWLYLSSGDKELWELFQALRFQRLALHVPSVDNKNILEEDIDNWWMRVGPECICPKRFVSLARRNCIYCSKGLFHLPEANCVICPKELNECKSFV